MRIRNEEVRQLFIEMVDEQINANIVPAVQATVDRLTARGLSELAAKDMIACVLINEVQKILETEDGLDLVLYASHLENIDEYIETQFDRRLSGYIYN